MRTRHKRRFKRHQVATVSSTGTLSFSDQKIPFGTVDVSTWPLSSQRIIRIKHLKSNFWRKCSILTFIRTAQFVSTSCSTCGLLSMMWAASWHLFNLYWRTLMLTHQPTTQPLLCTARITKSTAQECAKSLKPVKKTQITVMKKMMMVMKLLMLTTMLKRIKKKLQMLKRSNKRITRMSVQRPLIMKHHTQVLHQARLTREQPQELMKMQPQQMRKRKKTKRKMTKAPWTSIILTETKFLWQLWKCAESTCQIVWN